MPDVGSIRPPAPAIAGPNSGRREFFSTRATFLKT
jgi:hypothetical protein